jgi:hypothetical protein
MKGCAVRIRASASRKALETESFLRQGRTLPTEMGNRMGNNRGGYARLLRATSDQLVEMAAAVEEAIRQLLPEHSALGQGGRRIHPE